MCIRDRASDATPIVEYTDKVVYLEDEEIALIRRGEKLKDVYKRQLLRGCWWFSVRRAIAAREFLYIDMDSHLEQDSFGLEDFHAAVDDGFVQLEVGDAIAQRCV